MHYVIEKDENDIKRMKKIYKRNECKNIKK